VNKRQFLTATVFGATTFSASAVSSKDKNGALGPTLLTVSGAIGSGNRGALDPALDQMMKKQGVKFDKAYVFDFSSLTSLPEVTIKPTLEYDAKPHTLSGPLLRDVIRAAGVAGNSKGRLLLRAIDGYAVAISLTDVQKYRFIVATKLDGQAIPLGGLGPLWAVYDADRFPEMAVKPLTQRFALCPWGLYHIDVLPG